MCRIFVVVVEQTRLLGLFFSFLSFLLVVQQQRQQRRRRYRSTDEEERNERHNSTSKRDDDHVLIDKSKYTTTRQEIPPLHSIPIPDLHEQGSDFSKISKSLALNSFSSLSFLVLKKRQTGAAGRV